jgi:two-component system, OmpR family, alkaline phosphatase synthesis response regulator PhoP
MAHILVVEDNADLAFGLRINLEQERHDATVVHEGRAAVATVRAGGVDLVILDLMLPDVSGFEVLRILRGDGATLPIVVLSARSSETDRVGAFRAGADDYVTKPFSLLELLERINARLRGNARQADPPQLLRIDLGRRVCTFRNDRVNLTRLEFDLLVTLVRGEACVLSREQLLEAVWRLPADWNTRTVDAHICSLRRKLTASGLQNAVRTVHGVGITWAGRAELCGSAARVPEPPELDKIFANAMRKF